MKLVSSVWKSCLTGLTDRFTLPFFAEMYRIAIPLYPLYIYNIYNDGVSFHFHFKDAGTPGFLRRKLHLCPSYPVHVGPTVFPELVEI